MSLRDLCLLALFSPNSLPLAEWVARFSIETVKLFGLDEIDASCCKPASIFCQSASCCCGQLHWQKFQCSVHHSWVSVSVSAFVSFLFSRKCGIKLCAKCAPNKKAQNTQIDAFALNAKLPQKFLLSMLLHFWAMIVWLSEKGTVVNDVVMLEAISKVPKVCDEIQKALTEQAVPHTFPKTKWGEASTFFNSTVKQNFPLSTWVRCHIPMILFEVGVTQKYVWNYPGCMQCLVT